ncbi:hypothetical protein LWF15_03720 [Kineosporia rhizophila]|uniref:hypothetical protein n=1 Tax=Kineosporia TaxID=49184 RepID=UPI001E48163F|nr:MULTISPECIES: hypothetical protein [Kineosporia]MCE0534607.1 hypothetical protein [Kineosporia rhizophila]GLY15603.1 hypothetical protein Kisp01_26180 [Kineosporia sp. NBRC 101677]
MSSPPVERESQAPALRPAVGSRALVAAGRNRPGLPRRPRERLVADPAQARQLPTQVSLTCSVRPGEAASSRHLGQGGRAVGKLADGREGTPAEPTRKDVVSGDTGGRVRVSRLVSDDRLRVEVAWEARTARTVDGRTVRL